MSTRAQFFVLALPLLLGALAVVPSARAQTQVDLTNFTKNGNIYTNLNQQFPNTGAGVPGSNIGVPNATYLFDPSNYTSPGYVAGSDLPANGIDFLLTSNATGQDVDAIDGGTTLVVPVNLAGTTAVYILGAAFNGQTVNVTFTGSAGDTQTFNNIYLPDFNGGNASGFGPGVSDQTVLEVNDVGAGGSGNSATGDYNRYDLTELGFAINPTLQNETLTSLAITSNGYEPLVLGVTAVTNAAAAVPEPGSMLLLGSALAGLAACYRRSRV